MEFRQASPLWEQFGAPLNELAKRDEPKNPPPIPATSKTTANKTSQIPVTENIKTALSFAWNGYNASGKFTADYLAQTDNMLYCLIPLTGETVEAKGSKISEYRQFDFSGTQLNAGMNLLLTTEKAYIASHEDVAGTATAYGFDGIIAGNTKSTFDKLSEYMSAKGYPVEQVRDPSNSDASTNIVPGMIRFSYSDGEERLKILSLLSQFKSDNHIDNVGSTPAAAYAVALKDMTVQLRAPSAKGADENAYLTASKVTVSGELPAEWKGFSSDHWNAGQSYKCFKGEIDGQERDMVLRKDKTGRLILETGIEGGAMTDGTYFSNSATGGMESSYQMPSKMQNAILETMKVYGSKLDISLLNRPEQANETDPKFKAVMTEIDPNVTTGKDKYVLPPVTKDLKLTPDYNKAKLVTKKDYDDYIAATKNQNQPAWLASDGTSLSVTGNASQFSANATGYIPICAKVPPMTSMPEQLLGGDPSGSMGGEVNSQIKAFNDYSNKYNVAFQFLPFSGANVNVEPAGNLVSTPKKPVTKERIIARLEELKINELTAQLPNIDIVANTKPTLIFDQCKSKNLSDEISHHLPGFNASQSELQGIDKIKSTGMPYLLETGSKTYSVHYSKSDDTFSVYEVPTVSLVNVVSSTSVNRYDVFNDVNGLNMYNRGNDFDNYSKFFQNVLSSPKGNYSIYLPADFGDTPIVTAEFDKKGGKAQQGAGNGRGEKDRGTACGKRHKRFCRRQGQAIRGRQAGGRGGNIWLWRKANRCKRRGNRQRHKSDHAG